MPRSYERAGWLGAGSAAVRTGPGRGAEAALWEERRVRTGLGRAERRPGHDFLAAPPAPRSQERDLRRGSPRGPCGSLGEGDRRGPWALPRETDLLSRIPLVPGPGAQWAWLWGVWLQGRGLNREWCLRPLDPCDRVQMG